jgi:hypothetical protein
MQIRKSTSGLKVIVLSIVLSIVLLSGVSFVSTLQIPVEGQVQQEELLTPITPTTPTTPSTSTATTDFTIPSPPNPDNDPQQALTDTTATTVEFPQSPLTVEFPQSPLTVEFPPGTVFPLKPPQ